MQIVCKLESIEDGGAVEARVDRDNQPSLNLAVCRHGDQVFAWHNICPHQGRALNFAPNRFLFTPEGQLMCAAHGAVFEADTGLCVGGPCRGASLRGVAVAVQNGEVVLTNDDEAADE